MRSVHGHSQSTISGCDFLLSVEVTRRSDRDAPVNTCSCCSVSRKEGIGPVGYIGTAGAGLALPCALGVLWLRFYPMFIVMAVSPRKMVFIVVM